MYSNSIITPSHYGQETKSKFHLIAKTRYVFKSQNAVRFNGIKNRDEHPPYCALSFLLDEFHLLNEIS